MWEQLGKENRRDCDVMKTRKWPTRAGNQVWGHREPTMWNWGDDRGGHDKRG